MIVENIILRNMIINLGCALVDNHIPRDDIFDYRPIKVCNNIQIYSLITIIILEDQLADIYYLGQFGSSVACLSHNYGPQLNISRITAVNTYQGPSFGRHIVIALFVRTSVRPSVRQSVHSASCLVHNSYIL